jgi:SWI/SNF-related matrix-associated actin-dependent regulator 1 of chromatin subfamily A
VPIKTTPVPEPKKPELINQAKHFMEGNIPRIRITFKFTWNLVEAVKALSGSKFHRDEGKFWTAACTKENIEALSFLGFTLDETLSQMKETGNALVIPEVSITGLKKQMFPFQKEGTAFIEKTNGRCLLGDEMGLGKTIQALAWLHLHPEKRPVLIVCPSHLKLNWAQEIKMWGIKNAKATVLSGMKPDKNQLNDPITIINYDILSAWETTLSEKKFEVLIADEAHYFRTTKAKRTKAIKKIANPIPHRILISGTPAESRPSELYNAFQMISKNLFPSFWKYAHRYCGARHNGFGWDFSGASHTDELNQIITNTIMIRRLKANVFTELPDKIRTFLPLEMDNRAEYEEVKAHFENEISNDSNNATMLQAVEALKQSAVRGKMKAAISWISNFLESGNKLVVFAHHKTTITKLMEAFPNISIKIDGSVSAEGRQTAINRFQDDPSIRLFVGQMQAAGTGITLTTASNVAFLELPWLPGVVSQCEDRCHRIGQKDTVNIYYLLATNTIEEVIAQLLDKKRKVLDAILDGKETEQESLLMELIKQFKKGEK